MTANSAASIRDRLKRLADERGEDFNLVLTRFGLERLLYRLSKSRHAPSFMLKGALLFRLWYADDHRPTRDADLLGAGPNDVAFLVAVLKEVVRIEVNDGIDFDPDSVRGDAIREQANYGGVRLHVNAVLDRARLSLQVDVGFGDAVTPEPQSITYPTLLKEFEPPKLHAYPKATVIAEKFHAISVLGMTNTRLKDYFDLWRLLHDQSVPDIEISAALNATYRRRATELTADPLGLSQAFATTAANVRLWNAFLKRNGLEAEPLDAVVAHLRARFETLARQARP